MTREDIYKASSTIFEGLPDQDTFSTDMQDSSKASKAYQNMLDNKDEYEKLGVQIPSTVEEFQSIVTTDPKKKSTNTGSNGSQKTQQSSGSSNSQDELLRRAKEMGWNTVEEYRRANWKKNRGSAGSIDYLDQGPKVFQPQRVFNSAEEIDNYFYYLDQYKNDPKAQKEKIWFEQEYPNITNQFFNQGGKPLTIQGPVYEEQKQPSFKYDPGTLPKLQQKSTINNADLKDRSIAESSTDEYTIDPKTGKKIWKTLTDEELAQGLMGEISPRQDNLNVPSNIRQQEIQIQEQEKIKEAGEKVKGMTLQQIEEQYKQDLEEIDKQELYRKNYGLIESMIDNQFGSRSNDIDFKKLNVLNRSEVENAYGLLEQDYLEYLQKTNPQEYQRVNNEITAIKGKKSDERSLGEREVLENYRVQAMKMHNLLNGYVMTKLEKDYDIKGFYSGINVINSQVEAIDKQLEEMNIDPSGRGVTQPMMDKYNELVQKRNKLVSQVASLAEKTGVTPEIQAKYEDALGRYTDSKITTSQLRSLDSEVMRQKEENALAAKKRFDEAMSGDYSIVGEFARGYAGTVGKSFVDFIGRTWDIAGEAWGDTDYDIFDQMNNFVKGYTLQQQETFGTAQDMALIGEPKKYEELPLIYRLNNLTSSGLASISLAASGSLATGAIGLGSTVGGGLLMMGSTLADNYEEALSMNYSGQEAAEYASSIAAAEYMVESFFPDFNLFKVPQARNTFFQALKKTSSIKEALAVTFEQLPQSLKYQAKRSADNLVKEGFVEEAGAQALTDLIKTGFNEQNKDKGQFETFQSQDYLNTVLGGWLGAEGARVVGRLAKPFMPHEESAFYQAAINPQILQLAQSNEVEFPDEVQDIIDEFAVINNAMKSKPGWDNMTDDEKAHIVSEVRRMKYLESKNKETGIDDQGTKEEISNIKSTVEQYIDQARNNPKFKLPQYALQEPSTEEVLPRQQGATTETGGEPQGVGQSVQGEEVTQEGQEVSQEGVKPELENNPELIEQRRIETQSQIERTDLFDGVGDFSSELGGSDKSAVPTNRQKINGIEFVQYSHPETGSLDVIVTGTSDNDFVGFYRVYENGKPTNRWSSKFENQSRNKENFKTMISNAQDMLPEGHEYMEKTSISTDGLRVWNQQLDRGYELQYDENGKLKTNLVAINGDAIVNELGIPVNKGDFDNIRVSNKEDFEKVKKVLLPYLEKFGLDESNIRWLTGTVKIDLPVLLKSSKKQEVSQEGVKKEDVVNQPFGELPENTEDFTGIGAGYLKNNLWASKQLGKDSKTSLLGNIKNEVLNKGKKAFLYFIDPKLSEGQLDTENKYNTKLNDKINAQGNKTLTGAENAAIENEVGAELAKEGVKGELVSDEKDGTYRIFDTKNTELLGYIEATPELIEKISDPNITEEQAKQILFDEAGVKMGDNVLIHANENDLSKYKTQKDVESEDYVGKLEEAKKQKPEKFWSVSTPPVGDVKGGTLIKVKGGEAIVDKTGEIRGLYKYPDTEERGVGDQLVKKGIEAGGVKLDNFALDNLMDIYQRNGFKVVSRLPFSEKDAPEGWKKKEHGTPDVVAMIYDPENKLDIEEKQFTKDQYDEALAYRDSFVDAQKEAYGEQKPSQDEEAKRKSIADIIRGLKSKGGKLYSAGLGIPVAIWDGAVEIIASAVEAGQSVSKALNKAKKYLKDNLKDKYNEEVFNKLKEETEKQSGQKSNALNIDVESVRKKDRPGKRISKGLAKKSEDKKTIFLETDDISVDYVKKKAPQQFIKNAKIIADYPLVKAVRKSKPINTIEDAQEVYDIFVRQVADNLKYLMDEFDPEFKEIATLWYDGANAIANELAEEYGITPEQVAGILASLSPQKDWYQNVRLAELVLMAYKDNPVFSQEMLDYQKSVIEKSLYKDQKSPAKQLKKAEKKYKENKTKENKIALDEAKQKFESAVKDSDDVMSMLEEYIGKKMDQVPEYIQPYMVRTYHEVNTTKDYDIITPDGNKAGIAKKANGDNSKVAWGSYGEIGKAVSIYNNGSSDNITRTLGEMHKIRNFNNNIIDPMSKDGDVTIDTHAVAAALLIPLSGNSKEVGQNFGTGTGNSAAFGIKGLYFAYSDGYALAAKETGLLPRQVQSITWEAVRGLYTKSFKANKENVNDIKQIWKKYEDGEITIEQARELAKQRAGGINEPTWATGSLIDEPGESDQEENDGTRTDGDGSDTVRGKRKQPDGDILTEAVEMLSDAQETGGTEVTKAQKEVAEKLGEEGKKIAEIDRNFDKLADDLGFIKTCII